MQDIAGALAPDEELVYYTGPHWMSLMPTVAGGLAFMIAAFLGLRAQWFGPSMALMLKAAVLTMLIMSLYQYWVFQNTAIVVTNRRVLLQRNEIFQTSSDEFMLAKAETILVLQSLLGSMLDYGTLTLSGTGGTKKIFPYVMKPVEFRNSLQKQIMAPASPAPPAGEAGDGERRLGPVSYS